MGHLGLFVDQELHDLVDVDIIIANGDVDLVQQDHLVRRVADQLFRLLPSGLCHLDVARAVLCFPREALTHRVELADIAELGVDQITLAAIHATLDELHHGAFHVGSNAAEDHPERGRAFALALARMHDDQTFLVGLGRHDLITGGFLLCHLCGVAIGIYGHSGLTSDCSSTVRAHAPGCKSGRPENQDARLFWPP